MPAPSAPRLCLVVLHLWRWRRWESSVCLASLEFCLLINSADEIEIWCPSIPQQQRAAAPAKRILESERPIFSSERNPFPLREFRLPHCIHCETAWKLFRYGAGSFCLTGWEHELAVFRFNLVAWKNFHQLIRFLFDILIKTLFLNLKQFWTFTWKYFMRQRREIEIYFCAPMHNFRIHSITVLQ